MNNDNSTHTSSIRILKQTHEKIKSICKQEGRLMGAYVDLILNKAMSDEKINEVKQSK